MKTKEFHSFATAATALVVSAAVDNRNIQNDEGNNDGPQFGFGD